MEFVEREQRVSIKILSSEVDMFPSTHVYSDPGDFGIRPANRRLERCVRDRCYLLSDLPRAVEGRSNGNPHGDPGRFIE